MEKLKKKRSSRRLPYNNEIEVVSMDGQYCKSKIINISHTGLCINTDAHLQMGANILSRIPTGNDICELEAKVAWIKHNPGTQSIRTGIELTKTPDNYNEIYENIVRKFEL